MGTDTSEGSKERDYAGGEMLLITVLLVWTLSEKIVCVVWR